MDRERSDKSLPRPLRWRGSTSFERLQIDEPMKTNHSRVSEQTETTPAESDTYGEDIHEEDDIHDTDALLTHTTHTHNQLPSSRPLRQTRSRTLSATESNSTLSPFTHTRRSVLGITSPLSLRWFFSIIGAESFHLYLWIIKDLAWVQSWRAFSIYVGVVALLWCVVLLYHSLRTLNWHEIWNFIATFLWLFANFWWMLGEAHDYEYPDESPVSLQHAYSSSKVLEVALMWCLIYYLVILPFDLLPCSPAALEEYDEGDLKPRFSCFASFRQYENLHMLFWIAKDLAWNLVSLSLWLFCLVPTLVLAMDFLYISVTTKREDSTVDTVHFFAVLVWVVSNSIWAYGDFFMEEYSEPMELWSSSVAEGGFRNARWYSSWALVVAMIPVLALYLVWIPLTLCGVLQPPSVEADPAYHREEFINVTPVQSATDTLLLGVEALPPHTTTKNPHGGAAASGNKASLLRLLSSDGARGRLILQSVPSHSELEEDAHEGREQESNNNHGVCETHSGVEMVESTASVRFRQLSGVSASESARLSPSASPPSSTSPQPLSSTFQRLFYPCADFKDSSEDIGPTMGLILDDDEVASLLQENH